MVAGRIAFFPIFSLFFMYICWTLVPVFDFISRSFSPIYIFFPFSYFFFLPQIFLLCFYLIFILNYPLPYLFSVLFLFNFLISLCFFSAFLSRLELVWIALISVLFTFVRSYFAYLVITAYWYILLSHFKFVSCLIGGAFFPARLWHVFFPSLAEKKN